MTQDRFRKLLRRKYAAMAKRADQGSRQAAIRLFCLECMAGEAHEVAKCSVNDYFLYQFRAPYSRSTDS